MSQPSWDEMRARIGKQRGIYAGTPGKGPAGKTCHHCAHLRYTGQAKPSSHPKCGLTNYTHGDATTIHTRTPSCEYFEEHT